MAYGIQNYEGNLEPIDSEYPDGDIKDKSLAGPGTKNNRISNADIQQFFAKLMRLTARSGPGALPNTVNGIPDNEYNGFQYMAAAFDLFGLNRRVQIMDTPTINIAIDSNYDPVLIIKPTTPEDPIDGLYVTLTNPSGSNSGTGLICNYSPWNCEVFVGSGTIDGNPAPYILPTKTALSLKWDGASDWVIEKRYLLEDPL